MLKVYLNELRKVKRQKTVRMIMLVGVLMPTFSFALCLHNGYRFRNLVGMNILLGNFLVAPFLFSIILVMLFSMEEQNDTLKTILVTAVPKSKILLSKIEVAFTFVLIFSIINCLYTFAGGIFLGMSSAFVLKALKALFITVIAAVCGTAPVLLVIVVFHKKHLIALILANCFVLIDFLFVWQLTMLNCLKLHLPICIAYRITYPLSIVEYTPNLQYGLPFCLSLIGGYIIDREYTQNTQKNLFTIPVRWGRVIKAKVLVAFSLSIWIGLFSNIVLILTGMVMNCSQIAITDIWKIVISNFISPVCVLVGTLPIILWFSKAKGKYLWGATLSLLLGVSGVFVANGRAVNWHPITYCFSFIQCDSIYTTVLKIPFSCLAIVLYLLLSVIIYVFMYRKQEYPVS